MEIYFTLFASFFKIGLFGFGGGYAMLPLIQHEVVAAPHNWLSMADFIDIVAISQMTPGPIAINSATYVGYTVTGTIWGSLCATLGVCLPPFVIMLLISKFYLKFRENHYMDMLFAGLKPAIVGLIAAAALTMMNAHNFIDLNSGIIFATTFIATLYRFDPIKIILVAGTAGIFIY